MAHRPFEFLSTHDVNPKQQNGEYKNQVFCSDHEWQPRFDIQKHRVASSIRDVASARATSQRLSLTTWSLADTEFGTAAADPICVEISSAFKVIALVGWGTVAHFSPRASRLSPALNKLTPRPIHVDQCARAPLATTVPHVHVRPDAGRLDDVRPVPARALLLSRVPKG